MIALTYLSIAKPGITTPELSELLQECLFLNHRRQITGLLLYKEGKFMQVLEGPGDDVRKTFASIERDARHRSVIKLIEVPITIRLFPQWSMAFRNLNAMKAAEIPGYENFLNEEPADQVFPLDPVRAMTMLRMFRVSE